MKEISLRGEAILPFLKNLEFIDEVSPSPEFMVALKYIFILGAPVERMQNRINFFLAKIWPNLSKSIQEKVHIIFLTGDRKLCMESNEKESLLNPNIFEISVRSDWRPFFFISS